MKKKTGKAKKTVGKKRKSRPKVAVKKTKRSAKKAKPKTRKPSTRLKQPKNGKSMSSTDKLRGLALALKGAHAFFYLLKSDRVERLRLWDITEDSIVIDVPESAPMRRTILGYIPSIEGDAVFEIDGSVSPDELPDQMPDTLRVIVLPEKVRKLNRRIYPRHSFAPPLLARLTPSEGGIVTECRIINISAGGLKLESPIKLSPDENYTFNFDIELDDEIHSLSLRGSIVYEIPLKAGLAYGVRFEQARDLKDYAGEASIGCIDRTIDLFSLVNKLIMRSGS